ncbi:MAG: hypothetical protein FWD58_07670 [Firmicutes bacterium]|nr:hypothetical protein [Bacillota bacterium]
MRRVGEGVDADGKSATGGASDGSPPTGNRDSSVTALPGDGGSKPPPYGGNGILSAMALPWAAGRPMGRPLWVIGIPRLRLCPGNEAGIHVENAESRHKARAAGTRRGGEAVKICRGHIFSQSGER